MELSLSQHSSAGKKTPFLTVSQVLLLPSPFSPHYLPSLMIRFLFSRMFVQLVNIHPSHLMLFFRLICQSTLFKQYSSVIFLKIFLMLIILMFTQGKWVHVPSPICWIFWLRYGRSQCCSSSQQMLDVINNVNVFLRGAMWHVSCLLSLSSVRFLLQLTRADDHI